MAESLKDRLVKGLLEGKLVTQSQLNKALDTQKKKGGRLSDILVREGYLTAEYLTAVIGRELGIPPIRLSRYKIDPAVLNLLPKKLIRQYRIIPVSKIGDMLTIAVADPLNIFAVDDIKSLTGYKIGTLLTTEQEIDEAINEYYEKSAKDTIDGLIAGMKKGGKIEVVGQDPGGITDSATLAKMVQEAPVVKITNVLLSEAVKLGASDILIEPMEKSVRVRFRVDGILEEVQSPPKKLQEAIVSRLKVMAGLNIAERRLPQDGRFMARLLSKEVDFRVSILPDNFGEKAALRILDKTTAMLNMEKLGFEEAVLGVLKKTSQRPHGMMLVCGPTGSGKTTSLYSVIKHVDTPEKNIVTVEDPVEYQLKGINQVTIRPSLGLTFSSALRSILRQDPDIIMVGEIRDFDTADIAIKAALTGHLVLSTLHTTTACGSITRLVNMGVEPFLMASSVILVAAQRLVRKLCPKCKEKYKLPEGEKKELGLSEIKESVFYRAAGCKSCIDTGYKGRIGLTETLFLSPMVRELIATKAGEARIKIQARKDGMKSLRENGIQKAVSGITSLEEVLRVTVGDQEVGV